MGFRWDLNEMSTEKVLQELLDSYGITSYDIGRFLTEQGII